MEALGQVGQLGVDVEVVAKRHDPPHYSRKILLRRREDHVVVQYGIVRINLGVLAERLFSDVLAPLVLGVPT